MKHASVLLTEREYEITALIQTGLPRKEIAAILDISLRTVDTHLVNIFRKYNVRSAVQLVSKIHAGPPDLHIVTK